MSSRSAGTSSANMAAAPSWRPTRLARMACWSSSSVGTARLPFGLRPRAVIVDAQGAALGQLAHAVAGEMNFPDRRRRQRGEIRRSIPAMIVGADIDVVHVAQDAAAGALRHRGHELPFRYGRVPE